MTLKTKEGLAGTAIAALAAVLALAAAPAMAQEHGRGHGGGHGRGGGQVSQPSGPSGGGNVWRQGETRQYRPHVERSRPAPSVNSGNPGWAGRAERSQGGSVQQMPRGDGQRWNGYTQRSQRWNGEAQPQRRWNGQPQSGQRWNGQPRADTSPAAPSTSRQDWRQNRNWSQRNGTYSDGTRDRTYSRDGRSWDRDRDGRRDGNWRDRDNNWRDGSNAQRWHGDTRRVDRDGRRWNRDWRRDNRYDWSSYRRHNRDVYRLGRYYAPYRNYSYRRLSIGFYLDNMFFSNRYWIEDPWMYRLPQAYGPYRWIRYYDDALLVNIYDGEVVDVIHDFFW